ncbi:MAG: metal-dependent hydrolase [Myxococcota bacterium]|nr:metal-dependent hydrolase [Myxococcota bacterium]
MKKKLCVFVIGIVIVGLGFGATNSALAGNTGLLNDAKFDASSAAGLMSKWHKPPVTEPVRITWLGHAAFKLESGGKTVLIDPWITGNPTCPITVDDIQAADLILVTHDHGDHVGDTEAIALATGAVVLAFYDTALRFLSEGLPQENVWGWGRAVGGEIDIDGIKIVMTQATHSSDTGIAAGYIIQFPGGGTVYHAGDTGLFNEMGLYGALYPIHVALLPIGNVFTMDGRQAAISLRLLRPQVAIPMHFGTFPLLDQSADAFVDYASRYAPWTDVTVLDPGATFVLD